MIVSRPDALSDRLLTADALRQRFALSPPPAVMRDDAAPSRLRPAAVLVPLVDRADGLTVLLTRRTDHLHHHPGQVSFPGGRVEEGDTDAEMTALRETHEEIGLHPRRIELLGSLSEYHTGTGFRVTPVVGLVQPPFDLTPDTFEVAEIFEVPLGFLIDPANRRQERLLIDGRERTYYAMPWRQHHIWGATAGMLVMLSRFLGEPD